MSLAPADLATLSRLLDRAIALSPTEIEPWLERIAPEYGRLIPHLRRCLGGNTELDDLLRDGPRFETWDETVGHAGERIGGYRLIRELGAGGMGSVWLAEQVDGRLERKVALKLPRLAWGSGLAERMNRERDIGARLEHPNVARLYDAGVDDQGRPYLAFEYVDGIPLDAWCRERNPSVRQRLQLFVEVIRAVAYAHARLIVHRDLKPGNVLVDAVGKPRLLDFGIAKLLENDGDGADLTEQHGRALTWRYAAPEQIRGEEVTVAADVYSIGVMLFESLTSTSFPDPRVSAASSRNAGPDGSAPLASSRVAEPKLARVLEGEIDAIVRKALEPEVARRYPNADALADDIERHLQGERVLAQRDTMGYRLRVTLRRHRAGVVAATVASGAIALGGALAVVQERRASAAAQRQQLVTELVSDVFKAGGAAEASQGRFRLPTGDRFLREGAELIQKRFEKEPELQAQLLGAVAGAFLEMGAYEQAANHARRQVERLQAAAVRGSLLSGALITLSRSLARDGYWDTGDDLDADEQAEQAANDAVLQATGSPALRADALAWLARVLHARGKRMEASRTIDALAAATATLGRPSIAGSWLHEIKAKMLVNEYEASNRLRTKAIEIALEVEGKDSPTAAQQRLSMAFNCMVHGRIDEAKRLTDEAFATYRRTGGLWAVRGALGEARWAPDLYLWGASTHDQALSIVQDARRLVESQSVVPRSLVGLAEYSQGLLGLYYGDAQGAWTLMKSGSDALLADRVPNYTRFTVVNRLADAAMMTGRYAEAETLVREQGRVRQLLGETGHPLAVWDYVELALIYGQAGDFRKAMDALDEVPRFESLSLPGEQAGMLKDLVSWVGARILLDHGDIDGAWQRVAGLQPRHVPDAEYGFSERVLHAELSCARHEPGAVARLEAIADDLSQGHYFHALMPAWARAKAGLCAARNGDFATARRLAAVAARANAGQPGVADYYQRDLRELQKLLSRRQ